MFFSSNCPPFSFPLVLLVILAATTCRLAASVCALTPQKPQHFSDRGTISKEVNVGFDAWVSDAPEEVPLPRTLTVKGIIPHYVSGVLLRNGGGIWTIDDEVQCSHIFDGLAKLSKYTIEGNTNRVEFSTRFVDSNLFDEQVVHRKRVNTVRIGPLMTRLDKLEQLGIGLDQDQDRDQPKLVQTKWLPALANVLKYDNAPVNVWDFQPPPFSQEEQEHGNACIWALTDTPIRATIQMGTLETLQRATAPPAAQNAKGYELTATTHPEYCKRGSGATYNVGVHIPVRLPPKQQPPQLCLVRDNVDGTRRQVVGSYPLQDQKIPYIHSFGLTPTKAIVVLQPLRQSENVISLLENGFLPTLTHVNYTQIVVFDLETGQVVADPKTEEPVYFYHAISAKDSSSTTSGHSVSIQLCAYKTPDILTGPDMFFRFDRAYTKQGRNRISRGGRLCKIKVRLRPKKDTPDVNITWAPPVYEVEGKSRQGFELPTTRYSRTTNGQGPWLEHRHAKYVYAYGAYAYGSSEYDAWQLLKINTQTGEAVCFREQDSCYYSEPIFVADPDGKREDSGVLLCTRFDGRKEETSLLIINARTMEKIAEANTKTVVPMDFHGAFFPKN